MILCRALGALWPAVLLLAAGALPASAQPARAPAARAVPEDAVVYTVRAGDNLYALGQRYLALPASYREVQRINRVAHPRRLPPGTLLRIPVRLLRFEPLQARLSAARGTVAVRQGDRQVGAAPGTVLGAGAVIETGADGFASLAMPNGSRVSLPTRSRLRIVQLRRFLLNGALDIDLAAEAGKVETRASPLENAQDSFRIRMPRAVAAVRGTQFRAGEARQSDALEVLEGAVAFASPAGERAVGAGGGVALRTDGSLTEERLLPAPELVAPGKVQVDPQVRLALAEVPGASEYRVQIAADAGFSDVVAETFTRAPEGVFEGLPNGTYFARLSALAVSGLEGMAQTYAMRRVLTGLAASASATDYGMRFTWSGEGDGARTFHFQLLREGGALPLVDEPGLTDSGLVLRDLPPATYQWRVGVRQVSAEGVTENWSAFEKLIVAQDR